MIAYIIGILVYGLLLIYANEMRKEDDLQDAIKTYMNNMPEQIVRIKLAIVNAGASFAEAKIAMEKLAKAINKTGDHKLKDAEIT